MQARGRVLAGLYVVVVAALAASAFWAPDEGFTWGREGVAMLLTLPALIVALPVIYVVGAVVWTLTGADDGGPMWPVTLVYTLLFAGTAVANVWILLIVRRRRRRAATPSAAGLEDVPC